MANSPKPQPRQGLLRHFIPTELTTWRAKTTHRAEERRRLHVGVRIGLLITLIFVGAGAWHVLLEPGNPAVWLVMYFWTTPALCVAYYETHARHLPPNARWSKTTTAYALLFLSAVALALSFELAMAKGTLTLVIWGFVVGLFWSLLLMGADSCYEFRASKWLWHHTKQHARPHLERLRTHARAGRKWMHGNLRRARPKRTAPKRR